MTDAERIAALELANRELIGLLEGALGIEVALSKYLRTLPQERHVAEAVSAIDAHRERISAHLKGGKDAG